jgi:hypothetical protein
LQPQKADHSNCNLKYFSKSVNYRFQDCSKNPITDLQNRKSVEITDCTFMLFDAVWSSAAVETDEPLAHRSFYLPEPSPGLALVNPQAGLVGSPQRPWTKGGRIPV